MMTHEKAKELLEELKIKAILYIETIEISKAIIILHAIRTYWVYWGFLDHLNFIVETGSFKYNSTPEYKKEIYDRIEKNKENIQLHIELLKLLNTER